MQVSKDSSLTYAEPASAPLPIAQRLYDCGRCINGGYGCSATCAKGDQSVHALEESYSRISVPADGATPTPAKVRAPK